MKRDFFVSYSRISNQGGSFGFGDAVLTVNGPITVKAINDIRDHLAEQSPGYGINILSFQELETAEQTASV